MCVQQIANCKNNCNVPLNMKLIKKKVFSIDFYISWNHDFFINTFIIRNYVTTEVITDISNVFNYMEYPLAFKLQ